MPADPHQDRTAFDDVLSDAFSQTGEAFRPPATPRLDEVVAEGRRLRRRRATGIAGGVTALALIGAGSVLVIGAGAPAASGPSTALVTGPTSTPSPTPTKPSPSATQAAARGLAPGQVFAALKALLPAGQLTDTGNKSPEMAAMTANFASAVFDDGHGKAALSLSLSRGASLSDGNAACPSKAYIPYDDCQASSLADGSALVLLKGYEYPDLRTSTKAWTATLTGKDGRRIELTEWNAAQDKGASVSRATPPLDFPQLSALVSDPSWNALLAAVPQPPTHTGQRPAEPTKIQILSTAAALLPAGLTETDPSGQDGFANFTVDDGHGRSLVEINVQDWRTHMQTADGSQQPPDPTYAHATTLPDGTKIAVDPNADSGGKGGTGLVRRSVDVLRPDGTRVVIAALNGPSPRLAASRPQPALTLDQLKAIATSPTWVLPADH
ncbi:hypothetical protein [Kitasatospora sp. McL0602]|uniref:hypothetical protein n=1 Tax=Kitasatospora sp. McL0602 TaxID=3439530 RepID=UPI003F8A28E8